MAGNDREHGLQEEISELEALLKQVQTAGNRRDLEDLLEKKKTLVAAQEQQQRKDEDEAMEVDEIPELPQPVPVKVGAHKVNDADVDDLTVFSEISRFGWEDEGYGKEKVSVYIMSGIDGVGDLPKEQVACKFTKTSFDLKIMGLHGKNYRLVKYNLDKEIDPSKSSYRVKKNRITISLWKADKNNTWMNLTAKNPNKANKSLSSDPAAGIMDMMKNMYEEGDDEMKRTIAQAWTQSREKQPVGEL